MCFLQGHDLIGMPSCSHRGSCFTWAWPFGNWRFMGLYLPLCKSGLSPLKSTDVKVWVNKGESRPGAVIPALLLLFRLGFQTYNCNIFFLSFGNVDWGWAITKGRIGADLLCRAAAPVPGQVVVARFQLSGHSKWPLSALLQNSLFCYLHPSLRQQ